jgi:short-subunit dehydrogenase
MPVSSPVILITGASSGIGAATARLFSQNGYRTVLAARRMERLQALADEIQATGREALPIQADLSQREEAESLARAAIEHFGQVDILFNNAGFGRLQWFENLDPQKDIQAQLQVNLTGLIQMTQAVLPHMIERRSGHIINMGSIASFIATPTYSVYAASKFGVRGFSEALRREVGVFGVRISGIYPGGVETEFAEVAGIQRKTGFSTPPFLELSAEQVARAVLRLARRPRRALIIPGVMRVAIWANSVSPALLDWAVERLFVRKERDPSLRSE